jgi:hypothetical protein
MGGIVESPVANGWRPRLSRWASHGLAVAAISADDLVDRRRVRDDAAGAAHVAAVLKLE